MFKKDEDSGGGEELEKERKKEIVQCEPVNNVHGNFCYIYNTYKCFC